MKRLAGTVFAALSFFMQAESQDLSGKWYGKITQGPGGYASEYVLELEVNQKNRRIWGVSFAYYQEDVVAKFAYYGRLGRDDRIVLQEDRVLEEKTPRRWEVCVKEMVLEYSRVDSVEYLEGKWGGTGIRGGETCIPGMVYLNKDRPLSSTQPLNVLQPPPDSLRGGPAETAGGSPGPGGRTLKEGYEIVVSSPDITVTLSDYLIIDGDIVTVYFNDDKLVDKQLLEEEPVVLKLKIEQPYLPNTLVLYAENIGRIPPNTARMVVEDSKGTQEVKLKSDYQESDLVHIRYEP